MPDLTLDEVDVPDESLRKELVEANCLLKDFDLDEVFFDEDSLLDGPTRRVADADSLVAFYVRGADSIEVRAGDVLAFVSAAGGTWDGTSLKSALQRFVHMGVMNDSAKKLSIHAGRLTFTGFFRRDVTVDGVGFCCQVVFGGTPVALHLHVHELSDDSYPPYDDEEIYVWIKQDKPVSEAVRASVFHAYLFELATTAKIELAPKMRMRWAADVDEDSDAIFDGLTAKGERLRPLVAGPGTGDATKLFVAALSATDRGHRILGFAKVIEHVSATVIRLEGLKQIRAKLMSPHADPDVKYISELWTLVEGLVEAKKNQRIALELTVRTCCDVDDLRRIAPQCCAALRNLADEADIKTRENALKELASRISSTRNQLAHAKADYTPTGLECPEPELFEFAALAQAVAAQCIRWYADSDPKLRASRHGGVE